MERSATFADLVDACRQAWAAYGADVGDLTGEDVSWIVEKLGRQPTREEWLGVGLHIGC